MRFLVDMNLSPAWCEILQAAGWDAVHWSALGAPNATDAEISDRARSDDRVLFTHDLDFGAILANTQRGKPSVVQIRAQNITPEAFGGVMIRLLADHRHVLAEGAIVTVDGYRARVRILPLSD